MSNSLRAKIIHSPNASKSIKEQVCECNKIQTEIDRLKEVSQYFTYRGHTEVYIKLAEVIAEAEILAFAKRDSLLRSI